MTSGLGDRIRQVRKRMALTQPEFAQVLGVSLRAVQDWEGGKRMPRATNLRRIHQATGTAPEWLVTGQEPGGPTHGDGG